MIRLAAAGVALLAAGSQDTHAQAQAQPGLVLEFVLAQVTVRQHIIIRVPRGQNRVPASSGLIHWREGAGLRCIPARAVAGAMPNANMVDLVLRDNRRVRARLGGRCMALDYYRGLYVDANPDGQICAQRDAIRSRMGGQCEIVQMRMLQPVRP